jgi:hypothetical protein
MQNTLLTFIINSLPEGFYLTRNFMQQSLENQADIHKGEDINDLYKETFL